jgi:hypothetical protein
VGYRQAHTEELNKLVEDLLSAKPKIMSIEIEPSITGELLADRIRPWVEDIRQKLFHSRSAPFRSVTDAKKWLNAVNRTIGEWHKRGDEWHKKADEWEKKADEYEKRSDEFHNYWQAILETYPHLTGGIEKWWLMKEQGIEVELPTEAERQKLHELGLAMESQKPKIGEVGDPPERDEEIKIYDALTDSMFEIDKVIDFTWKSLEMYILADALPILPAFTVSIIRKPHSLPSGVTLSNRFASITTRGNLTDKDLRSLYQTIRRELGIKHLRQLRAEDLQLYKMVAQRGRISKGRGEIVKFWKSIKDQWNIEHPDNPKKTWKGFQGHYKRIISRFEQMTEGEVQKAKK